MSVAVSEEALAVHAAYPPVDLHADSLMWTRWLRYDLHTHHARGLPRNAFARHLDVPRMQEGGMGAQFFGLVSLPVTMRSGAVMRAVDAQIDALERTIARRPGELVLCRTAADVEAAERGGAIAALLGIEGAHALEGEIENVERFARRGVRYLGLLHFSANEAGYPAFGRGRADDRGLTTFGLELVERCEDVGVIVDLTHVNRRGFFDACRRATKPMIVSHTGVLGVYEHWRNIDDEQLHAVADAGGCIGVMFCPHFLGGDGLDPVVEHMKHIINIVGEDAVALGSDWDGFIVPTRELADPTGLPKLTEALLRSGLTHGAVGKALRLNALRVLAEA